MNQRKKPPSEAVWNLHELLTRTDNDQELLRELLLIFKEDFPGHISGLTAAIAAGNLKNVAAISHTLKGMFANLAANKAAAAAARLEQVGRAGENAALKDAHEDLNAEIAGLLPELEAYMAGVRR